jgi:hypothetical protein
MKAFGFAVGLRPVAPREAVAESLGPTHVGKHMGR